MIRDNNASETSDMNVKNMHKQAAVAIADVWQNWKIPGFLGDACSSTGMLLRVKWKYNKRVQKETRGMCMQRSAAVSAKRFIMKTTDTARQPTPGVFNESATAATSSHSIGHGLREIRSTFG